MLPEYETKKHTLLHFPTNLMHEASTVLPHYIILSYLDANDLE